MKIAQLDYATWSSYFKQTPSPKYVEISRQLLVTFILKCEQTIKNDQVLEELPNMKYRDQNK